jgi:hypothetical protein
MLNSFTVKRWGRRAAAMGPPKKFVDGPPGLFRSVRRDGTDGASVSFPCVIFVIFVIFAIFAVFTVIQPSSHAVTGGGEGPRTRLTSAISLDAALAASSASWPVANGPKGSPSVLNHQAGRSIDASHINAAANRVADRLPADRRCCESGTPLHSFDPDHQLFPRLAPHRLGRRARLGRDAGDGGRRRAGAAMKRAQTSFSV